MAKNPGAKDSKGRYLDPAAAINAGLMNKKSGEIMSPGKVVAKVAAKIAGKAATKATTKALKAVNKPTDKAAKAAAKVEKSALKAANKPTNKTGSKADRADRKTFQGQGNTIKNADPLRANRTRGGSLSSIKTYGGVGDIAKAAKQSSPKTAKYQAEISKALNPKKLG